MKKFLILVFMVFLCFFFAGCSLETSDKTVDGLKQNLGSDEDDNTATDVVPVIKGSQAYDVIISLEDLGITKPKTEITEDGFQWATIQGSYSYTILSNNKHEISYAEFMVLTDSDDEYFLRFCASIPYDESDTETIQNWIDNNIGSKATITVGDAVFRLDTGNQGPYLEISAVGYDEYLENLIMNK